jgi:hypothetical protein
MDFLARLKLITLYNIIELRLGVRYSFLAGPKPRKRRRVGREVSILTP